MRLFLYFILIISTFYACSKKENIIIKNNNIKDTISGKIYGTWALEDSINTANNWYYVINKNDQFIYRLYSNQGGRYLFNSPFVIGLNQMIVSFGLWNYKLIEDTLYLTNSSKTDKYIRVNNSLINEKNFVKTAEILNLYDYADIGMDYTSSNIAITENKLIFNKYYNLYTTNKNNFKDTNYQGNLFYKKKFFGVHDSTFLILNDVGSNKINIYKTKDLKQTSKQIFNDNGIGVSSISYDYVNNCYYIYSYNKKVIYKSDTAFKAFEKIIESKFLNLEVHYLQNNRFATFGSNGLHTFEIMNGKVEKIMSYGIPFSEENPRNVIQLMAVYKDEIWCEMSKYSYSKGKYINSIVQLKLN